MIYADNAATTKLDYEAFEAMKSYLLEEYGNASQPYFFSKKVRSAIKNARLQIARCINAEPEEIFFTSGGTESNNWVIKCACEPTDKKIIITSEIEHHAILNACKHMEKIGTSVTYIPVSDTGIVKEQAFEECLKKQYKNAGSNEKIITSIMLANNEIGTIEPIKELASIAHKYGAYFHTDAVQAVGHIPIDVKELGVDFLSASAHKFNGPKGIGFLYVKKGTVLQPFNDGGSQEKGMRAGTENTASIVGMAVALDNNIRTLRENEAKLIELERVLESSLNEKGISYIRNGDTKHIPGNMSFSFRGWEGEVLLHRLDLMGICVSTGSACDSVNTEVSHVLKAIGLEDAYAEGTIRISFGKNNTQEDAKKIASSLYNIMKCK